MGMPQKKIRNSQKEDRKDIIKLDDDDIKLKSTKTMNYSYPKFNRQGVYENENYHNEIEESHPNEQIKELKFSSIGKYYNENEIEKINEDEKSSILNEKEKIRLKINTEYIKQIHISESEIVHDKSELKSEFG